MLVVEKRVTSKLMESCSIEKVLEVDSHIGVALSGLIADGYVEKALLLLLPLLLLLGRVTCYGRHDLPSRGRAADCYHYHYNN